MINVFLQRNNYKNIKKILFFLEKTGKMSE